MSFDVAQINAAVAQHGVVHRIVIAAIKGSSPREVGAAMLVWPGGQSGSIGGGALEYQASQCRTLGVTHHPLGPELGQCCGGHVTLVTECFDTTVQANDVFIRQVSGDHPMPLAVSRINRDMRNGSQVAPLTLIDGWLSEPVSHPSTPLWIWGAGHVGRAVVDVLSGLPDYDITWVDTNQDRFPEHIPHGITCVPAADMGALMAHAPTAAHHLIFTYSHALDLALCHAALTRGFASCGVIGSKTKWARFGKRLTQLGHTASDISKISCPIGHPALGKHPKAIAIGVAADLMSAQYARTSTRRTVQ